VFLLFLEITFAYDATYYSDSFEYQKTANASIFSQQYDSAAICNLELGQYAYISYWFTWAVVTLNDRPNCLRYPDIIDLSKNSFSYFWDIRQGRLTWIQVTPLIPNEDNFPKRILPIDIFAKLGIKLKSNFSSTYFAWDHVLFEGRVNNKDAPSFVFLQNKLTGQKIQYLIPVNNSWFFSFVFAFPKIPGDYRFIISNNVFQIDDFNIQSVRLLDENSIVYPSFPNPYEIQHVATQIRPDPSVYDYPLLRLPQSIWWYIEIQQGTKKESLQWTNIDLSQVQLGTGYALVNLHEYKLSSPSSLDRIQDMGVVWSWSVFLDYKRESIGRDKIVLRQSNQAISFRFQVPPWIILDAKYYVTWPNGDVMEYIFPKNVQTEKWYLKTWISISGTIVAKENGMYKLEINGSDGIAWINIPITQGNAWNIINKFRNNEDKAIRSSLSIVQKYALSRINMLRNSLSRKTVILDETLSEIAQLKAKDMYTRKYFWHQTPDGLFITEYARSKWYSITQWLGENIAAWENVSDIFLQDGLEESPWHRANMIHPRWTKVGIGYFLKNKKIYLVQVFSE
jgi:uncharacterized protein YkwD